ARRGVEEQANYTTFVGCPARFGADRDELAYARTAQDLPVVSADPYLNELLIAYCEEALARRRKGRGALHSRVENVIVPLLPHGEARVERVAGKLGLSQRTLARRLRPEGLALAGVPGTLGTGP